MGKPCMVNLCSQEALHTIMSHIPNVSAVGKDENRKLTMLISDEVPHILLADLQDNILTCLKYSIMIDQKNIGEKDFKLFLEEH